MSTPCLRLLAEQHPGRFLVDVDGTAAEALFENNPYRTRLTGEVKTIRMENPLINMCDRRPVHFMESYVSHLGKSLGVELVCSAIRPEVYVSDREKSWISQVQEITGKPTRYWLICSGVKKDYTVKGWGHDAYQEVVRLLHGSVQFVQVGAAEHRHRPLEGVIDLRGKTDLRQLVRLAHNADGGVGPESFLHHLFAALNKPFVCLLSGFLPRSWVTYPSTTLLTRQQMMTCCQEKGACWRSRVVALGDGDAKDKSLCQLPILGKEPVPKCMAMISPEEVAASILSYRDGGRA